LNNPALSRLFKLKEWLTLSEAARHLSVICGEEVSDADILRLALDGHLKLSVNFINHAYARCGHVVGIEDVEWGEFPVLLAKGLRNIPDEDKGKPVPYIKSLRIRDELFLNFSEKVTVIDGVWDLPMIGGERLDIEHKYQGLIGGPEVTL